MSSSTLDRARCAALRLSLVFVISMVGAATVFGDTVVVIADRALIWNRPAGVAVIVLTQAAKGTVLDVVRRVEADWYEVVLPPGPPGPDRTGFIRMSQVMLESVGPLSEAARRAASPQRPRAQAGPRGPRMLTGFLNVDAAYRPGTIDLTRSTPAFAERYAEEGSVAGTYGKGSGWQLGVVGGRTFWHGVGVGFGIQYYLRETAADVEAVVPHPFFFGQPRRAAFETPPLAGHEIELSVPLLWTPAAGGRVKVMVFGGPSMFRVTRRIVTDLSLDDPYPHDTVSITAATTAERSGTSLGFHAGGDVAFMFNGSTGVGVVGRYSRADIAFDGDQGATTRGRAGGPQIGVGLRFRF
jgi:hypothetical protein